ncbi:unnamed protein product [Durusdinium trenchii]|uniref:WWE domain-containing protein n=1 Tax=Durusdinium trenchii TaxID=1381693 RepID=A0ABP0J4W0_9DINO
MPWQLLSHARRGWVEVCSEEEALLQEAWNSYQEGGNQVVSYRLATGVPVEVDFAAQLRRNLASRRSVQLRRAARPAAAPTPMVPLLAGVTAVPTASREGSVPSGKVDYSKWQQLEDSDQEENEHLEETIANLPLPAEILKPDQSC